MDNNQNQKSGGIAGLLKLNRATRVGSWTVTMVLILLAVLVVVNLLVGALPSSWTKLDISSAGIYTISAITEKYVSALKRDVNIIVVTQGQVSEILQTFLDRYGAMSSHVKVSTVDPVADPTFLDNYSKITGSGNYIVVESDLRYTVVDINSLEYVYIEDLNYSVSVEEYNSIIADPTLVAYYAQFGADLYNAASYFAGEQAITSAIEYVATESVPHLYVLAGHGEEKLPAAVSEMFDDALLNYEALTLTAGQAVPDDASCVIIYAPQNDLTEGALTALSDFVDGGGNLMLLTTPDVADMPNLMRLTEKFGASATTGGMLYEGNANQYVKAAHVLLPKVNSQHEVTYVLASQYPYMVMPNSHGILLSEKLPENVKATQLMNASDAYVTGADGKTTDFGAVAVGVALQNSSTGSKVVWYASADAFSDASVSTYGNNSVYYCAIAASWLNDGYASTLTGLKAVDISETPLTVPALTALVLGGALVIVVPGAIVIGGIVVWARRRKR